MHTLYFVLINKEVTESSSEARLSTINKLEEEGFVGEDTFFGSGKADWFVIGGRWSGILSAFTWAKDVTERIQKLEEENDIQVRGAFYGRKEDREKQERLSKKIEQMWEKDAPVEYKGIGYDRNQYAETGYEDDVMMLDEKLIKELEENHSDCEIFVDGVEEIIVEDLDESYAGKYWIVVVDYHF